MVGEKIIEELVKATGLPKELALKEITQLIYSRGKTPSTITVDDLRQLLAVYLQDVLLEAKREFGAIVSQQKQKLQP